MPKYPWSDRSRCWQDCALDYTPGTIDFDGAILLGIAIISFLMVLFNNPVVLWTPGAHPSLLLRVGEYSYAFLCFLFVCKSVVRNNVHPCRPSELEPDNNELLPFLKSLPFFPAFIISIVIYGCRRVVQEIWNYEIKKFKIVKLPSLKGKTKLERVEEEWKKLEAAKEGLDVSDQPHYAEACKRQVELQEYRDKLKRDPRIEGLKKAIANTEPLLAELRADTEATYLVEEEVNRLT